MLRLIYSNHTEALLEALAEALDGRRRAVMAEAPGAPSPLEPVTIVVPNRNVERYLELGLARRLGVAAGLRFERLGALVERALAPEDGVLLLGERLEARALAALLDQSWLAEAEAAPVVRYLEGAGEDAFAIDRRRAQLGLRIAHVFEELGYSRPELLEAWRAGTLTFEGTPHARTERWQASLFRRLASIGEGPRVETLAEALARLHAAPPPSAAEPPLYVFGLSYVARLFVEVFAAFAARREVVLLTLNPCEEFWEDVETVAELRRRRRFAPSEPSWVLTEEDPFDLSVDTESPLLRLFGRPGREHVRLLGALTDCDFESRFVDPLEACAPPDDELPLFARAATPLLAQLQHDAWRRAPLADAPPDRASEHESLVVLACPSVRREVETVADEIWSLVEADPELAFHDIAVLVHAPDKDLYLPQIAAVFEAAQAIPHNVVDLALASASPIVDAATRLLALPTRPITRPEVLAVLDHPAVRGRFPELASGDWPELLDRLGVFRGLDREAHRGTYVEADALNFEQGMKRIALGAFVEEAPEGAARFVGLEGHDRYLPEPERDERQAAARFAWLWRSLASDLAFAREAERPLADWARFGAVMLETYLFAADEREEASLRRALAVVADLARLDLEGAPVTYGFAQVLFAQALGRLEGARGQSLAEGVAVSTLVPMRAIPFRVIFILGLGEGRFPAADRRDALDLRAARRQAGDVTPSERDRYTFLEALLSCRERLYLSYVARDEQTGDPLAPSVVLTELFETLEAGYLKDARQRITRAPKLRRHEEASLAKVLPEACSESRASRLGGLLRDALGDEALGGRRPAELARGLAAQRPRLEASLGLLPLPRPSPMREGPRRLQLSAFRRFLECPVQGWARAELRLDESDDEALEARADESFVPSRLEEVTALREAFAIAALEGLGLEAAYARVTAPRSARGRWPIGRLASLAAERHLPILETWWRAASALGLIGDLRRFRFGHGAAPGGSAAGHAESAQRAPLILESEATGRLELGGRTELVAGEPRASLLLELEFSPYAAGELRRRRHALRGFYDHLSLSAAGEASAHRIIVLHGDREDGDPRIFALDALDPRDAEAYLLERARELLRETHTHFFPCEGALTHLPSWTEFDGEALVDTLERVRIGGGGQSRFGPVPDVVERPAPPPVLAEAWARSRFSLFAELSGGRERLGDEVGP